MNAQRTRFTHRVNTKDASSGSPIFDMNLQVVGLHRGWVRPPDGEKITLNEAIPIDRIRRHFLANATKAQRAEVGWG